MQTASTFYDNLSQLQNSSSKTTARIGKAAAITSATIDAYKGASGAFADTNGHVIIRAAAAAAALAAGFARIQQIRGVGGFAEGGIVPGSSFSGDSVTASVNSGEMVLNRSQQAQLFQMANAPTTKSTSSNKKAVELKVNVENYGPSEIEVQQLSENEVRIIAHDVAKKTVREEAPTVIASDFENPNGRASRSLARNTNIQRKR